MANTTITGLPAKTPTGAEYIAIEDGTSTGKATLNAAVAATDAVTALNGKIVKLAAFTTSYTFYGNSVRNVTVTPSQLGLSGTITALMTQVNVNDATANVLATCSNYIGGTGIRLILRSFESANAEHPVTVSLLYM